MPVVVESKDDRHGRRWENNKYDRRLTIKSFTFTIIIVINLDIIWPVCRPTLIDNRRVGWRRQTLDKTTPNTVSLNGRMTQ